ncbi:MAG: hypothetical protein P8047_13200 [Gammaproteobacteria bacterium]
MKNLKQISQIGLMASLMGVAAFAQAANGTAGTTSTGTMNLSVIVPKIVVIKNVTSPAAVTFNGSTAVNLSSSLCVGTNATGYTITATSTNAAAGAPFILSDGTNTVAYNVAWATSAGATTGTAFGSSGATQSYATGPVSNIACAANNATAVITVPAANLQTAPASTYSDTLSLTVAPL